MQIHSSNIAREGCDHLHLIKVTPSMLKQQNGRKGKDAWSSFQGKVYNITPYLPFHPGGKGELMQGAGTGLWEAVHGDSSMGEYRHVT